MTDQTALLARTAEIAAAYLAALETRPVGRPVDVAELRAAMGGPLPDGPSEPLAVVELLAATADAGLVASAGPRYFGFVVGGGLPAALAADWLASTWDQNAGLYILSPAAAVAEEIAAGWLVDLLELPAGTSVGFVTGATMANFTALAAARHAVLAKVGWDVERQGLQGAPQVTVVTHEGTHVTVYASLQMLGLGREGTGVRRIASDDQGRMRPDALREVLADLDGPTIVCAQAGNVNTRRVRPVRGDRRHRPRARRVGPHRRRLRDLGGGGALAARRRCAATPGADSWSTDAHKWLNVPYDSGLVFVRDADAHHAAMTLGAAYYVETAGAERDRYNWVPESSRRARGFAVLAALRSLGRSGLVDADRARLRAGPADGRAARAGSAGRDPERRGAEPGPRPFRGSGGRARRGRRCPDTRRHRRGPA